MRATSPPCLDSTFLGPLHPSRDARRRAACARQVFSEFRALIYEKLRLPLSPEALMNVWRAVDENGSGAITFTEFSSAIFPDRFVEIADVAEVPDGVPPTAEKPAPPSAEVGSTAVQCGAGGGGPRGLARANNKLLQPGQARRASLHQRRASTDDGVNAMAVDARLSSIEQALTQQREALTTLIELMHGKPNGHSA